MQRFIQAVLCAAVLQLGLSAAVQANETTARSAVANVKYAAIQELQTLLGQALRRDYPAASRVSVYLDAPIGRFILEQATLTVNGEKRVTRNFSEREALALLEGGAERILRFNADTGKHNLRIVYSGHLRTADGSKIGLQDAIELDFDSKPGAQAFILPAAPRALRPITSIRAPDRENWNWRRETDDPRLNRVRFLRAQGENFEGLLELLEVAGVSDGPSELPRGYHKLLALSYLDFDLRNRALDAARTAWRIDPEASGLADAWLGIARLDYRHGEYAQALQILAETARLNLDPTQKLLWQDLQSRSLMAQGQYAQAAGVLQQANQTLDTLAENPEFAYAQTRYLRYNYAVALIKSGQTQAGRALLDRMGQQVGRGGIANPLRDQANLALAYHYLDNRQGASAIPVFQRLPLVGPYTNHALLGLGWAQIAANNNEPSQARQALITWSELARRNDSDPAVLEARLARAYAMERLGQFTHAANDYRQASKDYAHARRRLQDKIRDLRQSMFSQAIAVEDLSGLPASGLVAQRYASHAFQAHLRNTRQMQKLGDAVRAHGGSEAVVTRLARSASAQIERAQTQLADALEQQLSLLSRFERSAQFGMLRSYEQR